MEYLVVLFPRSRRVFIDGAFVQGDGSEPYDWGVTNIPEGQYEIYVVASDLSGNETMSNVVNIGVGGAPATTSGSDSDSTTDPTTTSGSGTDGSSDQAGYATCAAAPRSADSREGAGCAAAADDARS